MAPQTVALMDGIEAILETGHPMSARGVFYAAEVRGLVDKSEKGCTKVQRVLVRMREEKRIPWSWITDGTRWRRGPRTFDGIDEALRETARLYRRDLWSSADEVVEVWLEKEALAGVVLPVTDEYAVDLMVTRGFPSLSYLHNAAEHTVHAGRPLRIYYLGDRDPSGRMIPDKIAERLDEFGCDFTLSLLAVTDEQVETFGLPSRPTKREGNRHAIGFEGPSVELDAMPANALRDVVERAILGHVDPHRFDVLRTYEREEREGILALAGRGMP